MEELAEKRMFSKTIIDSDAFLDMPMSARLLYYDLGMRADDDGFINSPKKIMRDTGASKEDMDILADNKFIITFDDGIVVIKHWRIHNYIAKDRYKQTKYKKHMDKLEFDENKAYTLSKHKKVAENEKEEIEEPSEDLEVFFESIWQLYPIKKGKGAISKTKKKVLQKIGYEEIERCVNRFIKSMGNKDKQYWMHGSTFFNSGYVDYLDKNYETEKPCKSVEISKEEENMDLWSD